MPDDTITLPAPTPEKIAQLAQLLEQAERLAREKSQEKRESTAVSQAWYWSRGQAMEYEAYSALAKGEYREFDSAETLLADVHARV